MAKNSHIEWTHHTFNPWWGCHKVSPACDNCYAEVWAKRVGQSLWGRQANRRFFGEAHWREPVKWNKEAADTGKRARVFCASMADVFEDQSSLNKERARLWALIELTPNLDWLLLTKRPQYILPMAPWGDNWPNNVWIGTSIENQRLAELRLPDLLSVPATIRFLSCEPLLGPLDLSSWFNRPGLNTIDWVIAGGESGAHSRAMHPDWVLRLLNQCKRANVPFHFKQWGQWVPADDKNVQRRKTVLTIKGEHPIQMVAVGKKLAGRTLQGTTWDRIPQLSPQIRTADLHKLRPEVKSKMAKGIDREHFESYREQTRVKHDILVSYLPAYYNILKRSNPNLIYIDGFAGRGHYTDIMSGETFEGSPLLALQLIANSDDFSKQVSTIFIESDDDLFAQLTNSVDNFYRANPDIRKPDCRLGTFSDRLNEILGRLKGGLAPTFLFVDPCGVSGTSFETIRAVMDNAKCEAFIFFNIDGVRRIAGLGQLSTALVELMGSEERATALHEKLRQTTNVLERERIILSEYSKALAEDMGVKYIIPFRVEHEDYQKTSHYLIHASKHSLGFRIMKDVMWRRGHGEDQPGALELRQRSRTNFVPLFDRHEDIKLEILSALAMNTVRTSVFYEDWTARPIDMQCEGSYREALLELEREGTIEVLAKNGKKVVRVDERRKFKGKPTLSKEHYVRLKE
jgi:three-Cys-motif partner protein